MHNLLNEYETIVQKPNPVDYSSPISVGQSNDNNIIIIYYSLLHLLNLLIGHLFESISKDL